MHGQHGDEHNQRAHHRLGDALHAVLQAKAANGEAKHNGQRHVAAHFAGAGKHLPKHAGNRIAVQAAECAGQEFDEIAEHPSADGCIIHHQHAAAQQAQIAVQMPLRALFFQRAIGLCRCAAARASDSQLHCQHRNAHRQKKNQVEQHEHAAAVLPRYRGKAPHVANADRTAGADQDETKAGSKTLPLFARIHKKPLFLWYCRMGLQ